MGPCLSCYFSDTKHLPEIVHTLILETPVEELKRSKKGNHWTMAFKNRQYEVSIKEADQEIMLDEFILEGMNADYFSFKEKVVEVTLCCNSKHHQTNNDFVNQLLSKCHQNPKLEIIGVAGKSEFELSFPLGL